MMDYTADSIDVEPITVFTTGDRPGKHVHLRSTETRWGPTRNKNTIQEKGGVQASGGSRDTYLYTFPARF